jgi:hypothetical protein
MNFLQKFPNDFGAPLLWIRDRTETASSSFQTRSLEKFKAIGSGGRSLCTGSKWQSGLEAVAGIEGDAVTIMVRCLLRARCTNRFLSGFFTARETSSGIFERAAAKPN